MSTDHGTGASVIVPIFLVVFAVAITLAIVKQEIATAKLSKTDEIACSFLVDDSQTRSTQATNSGTQVAAEERFDGHAGRLESLFGDAKTVKARAETAPLIAYLAAQVVESRAAIVAQRRNIALTRKLSRDGAALAAELSCA